MVAETDLELHTFRDHVSLTTLVTLPQAEKGKLQGDKTYCF
jgi:hypothetical protein